MLCSERGERAVDFLRRHLRSPLLAQLQKGLLVVLGYGSGIASQRLYVQDSTSGRDGWISVASQNGKRPVAPTEASADEVQKEQTQPEIVQADVA